MVYGVVLKVNCIIVLLWVLEGVFGFESLLMIWFLKWMMEGFVELLGVFIWMIIDDDVDENYGVLLV